MTAPDDHSPAGGQVTLRYWAAAKAAAGVDSERISIAPSLTLEELISQALALHSDPQFARVIGSCSVMVGERPVSSQDPAKVQVSVGDVVEFLPPFAGG